MQEIETPRDTRGARAVAPIQALSKPRYLEFTLALAIKDLDLLLPLDGNADGNVTWGEIKAVMPALLPVLNVQVNTDTQACALDWRAQSVERRSDGAYLRFSALVACPPEQALALRYTLFRMQDATHRLLVTGRIGGLDLLRTTSPQQPEPMLLHTPAAPAVSDLAQTASDQPAHSTRWQTLRGYFALGVQHLLQGYDHLAFLLALVLPLRLGLWGLRSAPGTGSAAGRAWRRLLCTITAFTLGHSITLMLATFGWTQASPRWVEPLIAASIAVTALLNLRPLPGLRTDVLAGLFGLVHGLGFAGLLQEAAASNGLLPWALAGFNLGVEAGQLIAVSAWVLLAQTLVHRAWYGRVVVQGGSVLLVLLALGWFWQRVGSATV